MKIGITVTVLLLLGPTLVLAQGGSITGTITFAGIEEAPYPRATLRLLEAGTSTVLRSAVTDPADGSFNMPLVADGSYDFRVTAPCFATIIIPGITVNGSELDLGSISLNEGTSSFNTIQLVLDDFSETNVQASPHMSQQSACSWSVDVQLPAGGQLFKFVTGGALDNDYGGDEGMALMIPGTHSVIPGVSGPGTAVNIQVPAAGLYRFILDEARQQFTATLLVPVEPVTWGQLKRMGF